MNKKIIKLLIIFGLAVSMLPVGGAFSSAQTAYTYRSGGRRDPFVPLAGVKASSAMKGFGGILSIEDISLQGILVGSGGEKMAIINGEIMKIGDVMGDFKVLNITSNVVDIKIGEKEHKIKLYE